MTATDPRPELAAMLAERLVPAAAAPASACAEDISAGAAAHLPEPERAPAEEPANDLDDWTPELRTGFDGSEDLYNFSERRYVGRLTTPAFRDWLARQERREAADIAAREAAAGGAGAGGW